MNGQLLTRRGPVKHVEKSGVKWTGTQNNASCRRRSARRQQNRKDRVHLKAWKGLSLGDMALDTSSSTKPTPPSDAMKKYLEMTQGSQQPKAPPEQKGLFEFNFKMPKMEMPKEEAPSSAPEPPAVVDKVQPLDIIETPPPDTAATPDVMPKFEAPKFSMPKFEAPKMPKMEVPKMEMPKMEAPSSAPEPPAVVDKVQPLDIIETPPADTAATPDVMPKFEAPKFEAPKFEAPKFEAPKFSMPKFEAPKMPKMEVPKMEAPSSAPEPPAVVDKVQPLDIIETPPADTAATPDVMPKFEAPKFEAPKFEAPKFEAPKFSMPKFEAPKMPKMEVPKMEVPKMEMPKMEAPSSAPEPPAVVDKVQPLDIIETPPADTAATPTPTPPSDALKKYMDMTQGTQQPEAPAAAPQGGFEMPKFEAPKFSMPKFEAPKMPKMEVQPLDIIEAPPADTAATPDVMPKFEAPKFEAPKFEAPKFEAPKFEAPKFSMPKFEAPKMPKMEVPKMEVPKMEMPKMEMPSMPELPAAPEAPSAPSTPEPGSPPVVENVQPLDIMETPPVVENVQPLDIIEAPPADTAATPDVMPKFEAPKFEAPKFEAPKFEAPKFEAPKFSMPKFEAPKMPKMEVPKMEVPKMEMPKMEMPSMPELPAAPEAPSAPSTPEPGSPPVVENVQPLDIMETPPVVENVQPLDIIETPPADTAPPPSTIEVEPAPPAPSVPAPAEVIEAPPAAAPEIPVTPQPEEASGLAQQKYLEMTGGKGAGAGADSQMNLEMPKLDELELPKIELPDVGSAISNLKSQVQESIGNVDIPEAPKLPEVPSFIKDFEPGSAVSAAKDQALDYLHSLPLPEPVNQAIDTAASQDPKVYTALAQYGLPLLALLLWNDKYAGYAGIISPRKIIKELLDENSDCVLIDLRDDVQRENDGIPDLKFKARERVQAIPFQGTVQVAAGTMKKVSSGATKLQIELTALLVSSLRAIDPKKTKIFLMTSNKSTTNGAAKDLARRLRKKGCKRPYIMEGGFREWEREGLPVVYDTANYQKGTIKVVSDRAEILASEASEIIADPVVAVGAALGAGGLGLALLNYHYVLQFIGVSVVLANSASYLFGFDNKEALWGDMEGNIGDVLDKSSKLASQAKKLTDKGRE
ncbi:hypothetical protein A3770_18p80970 [Chloropicon primus]|uniref:Rhodanese domain-containing protein n=1 Tax=Chloropicon primus TaxID=1764295 RepID=A0A5B8MYB3_9CHLO|nr:hypothetical protein A3770_18p80970 [Chloropicon primus]|eukprot:QDZ25579.1 hypothetical protein A3770_18p80970 [Chloropicon primus]